VKIPTTDCGWCGHPKDEPPLQKVARRGRTPGPSSRRDRRWQLPHADGRRRRRRRAGDPGPGPTPTTMPDAATPTQPTTPHTRPSRPTKDAEPRPTRIPARRRPGARRKDGGCSVVADPTGAAGSRLGRWRSRLIAGLACVRWKRGGDSKRRLGGGGAWWGRSSSRRS
jgi:hypothetical protein